MSGVRETSHIVYRQIMAEGLLSRMRARVYELTYRHGPATASEMAAKLAPTERTQRNLHARLNELREIGVVEEIEQRPCRVTGRPAIVWGVTGNLPTNVPPQRQTKTQQLETRIANLQKERDQAQCDEDRTRRELSDLLGRKPWETEWGWGKIYWAVSALLDRVKELEGRP